MMKRIIALLLALILTVCLLPTVALAAVGETPAAGTSDVKDGYYDSNKEWVEGELTQNLPDGVEKVSKTAARTADNTYEVTLKVVLKQTEQSSGKAATVLVLDTSGSMAYCAECGKKEDCEHSYEAFDGQAEGGKDYFYKNNDGEYKGTSYCDGNHWPDFMDHSPGWYTGYLHKRLPDGTTIYVKKNRISRLDAAKVAAVNFLKTYSGLKFNPDGTVAANQNNRNLGRYVSVVTFATGVTLRRDWIDVSNPAGYENVLGVFTGNSLEADGGTNLDAGLTYAEYLLKQDTMKNATKNVIALTDGRPTYCLKKNCSDWWHGDNAKLKIGNTRYCVHGSGKKCTDEIYNSTVATATRVKNVPSKLYTVCFDAGETIDVPNNGGQISVSKYLSTKIATQPTKTGEQFAYDADNAEQLYAEFAKITQSIVSGLNAGTVKDTLPTGISSTVFGEDETVMNWELNSTEFTKTEQTRDLGGGKKETVFTYTKIYTVTIDPDKVQTTDDGYAPLNGETTLTVGSGADAKEIPFPIPAGKVTMPSHTVTWKSQDGNTTLETDNNVEYNTKPSFDQADPTKADDAQYTYTFVGWATEANKETGTLEADLPPVTDDVTYYAAFSKTARTYTVTWMPQDGQGNAYETDTGVAYNASPSYDSEVPTKAADAEHTYTFVGWATSANQETGTLEANLPAVTADVTYYAAFSKTPRTYTVTWMPQDGQGNAYETDTGVAYNARPSYDGTEPTKAADAEHTYTFVGWATTTNQTSGSTVDALPNVTADVTYYAAFSATKQTYTIRFETEAGGTLTGTTECTGLSYGADFPAAPTTTSNVGYYFAGWYDANDNKVTDWPNTVTENATYTAKWLSYNSINLDLTGKIQKTLNSDVALTNEIFTINLTLNGAEVPSATATATVSPALDNGSYTDTKPFVATSGDFKLTFTAPGTYIYSIVEEAPTRSGMTYDVNKYNATGHTMTVVVKEDAAHALSVTRVTVDGTAIALTDTAATWLTVTNEYKTPSTGSVEKKTVQDSMTYGPSQTINDDILSQLYAKHMDVPSDDLKLVVDKNTNEVTLAYEVSIVGEATATAEVEDDGAEYVTYDSTVDGVNVNYDETTKIATVTFAKAATAKLYYVKTFTRENGEFATAKNFVTVNDGEPVPSDETTIIDKDPGSFDFSGIIRKELKLTGSKSFTGAEFEATLTLKDFKQEVLFNSMLTAYAAEHVEAWPKGWSRTLVAKFDSTAVDGSTTNFLTTDGNHLFLDFPAAGTYKFELQETNKTRTNVTYDDTVYTIVVKVTTDKEHQNYDKLVVTGIGVEYVDKDGNKVTEDVYIGGEAIGKVMTFVNTVDTGKDDYYPIIIPTIINKDTGMLNKTDHFAYVIGYPDGTVHPNGQITRAEVATIFFRLLRDEVRDGAFTTSNTYSDVAYGKWYNNPISTMSALGIITGYPDGTFKPNKPITRAEFAAIAARFDETQSGKSATFSDVIGHWAAKEIGIAYYNDWIKGYPDGTFKPDQNITRAEAMTLINRVLERKPESPADLLTNMNKWTDNMDTSKWYYLDVQEATNSHGYTRKTFNYELWRQMLPDPDWSRYER